MLHTETWFSSIQTVSQDPYKVGWLRGTGLRQASGGTARRLRTPSRTLTTSFARMPGVSSELDYVEQTSWIIFLKYLDDLEKDREDSAALSGGSMKIPSSLSAVGGSGRTQDPERSYRPERLP